MVIAIIAGGGSGTRLDSTPKAFLKLGDKELIYYSLDFFYGKADEIIAVLPSENVKFWEKKLKKRYNNIKVAAGGKHRQDSVGRAVDIMGNSRGIVLVHDVARPFLSRGLFERTVKGALRHGASIPFIEVQDTLKENNGGFVEKTLDRSKIVQIQTPQAFRTDILRKAYAEAAKEKFYGSDDAVLVERLGVKVYLVKGERENIKITYPVDLQLAKTILKKWKTAE
ncbi:MAG TPA: 2-C-methyl-D-erythritol 4-phosphate cytidylyltransferase [bacterium]|nr:2-C-methyl-D-erythritol 4-phosphate cytidylyltransferase [bacterium]